jgi:hypothetical protein
MREPSVSSIAIYQLRVVLCGVSPLVWRRLLVVSTTSIAELHEILPARSGALPNSVSTLKLILSFRGSMAGPQGFPCQRFVSHLAMHYA